MPPHSLTENDRLEEALTAAVVAATGNQDARPREGQMILAEDVHHAMWNLDHVVGIGKTGIGKSLAYLVPAVLAAERGERTVVSTESLALQAQIATKDAPTVVKALAELTGFEAKVSVLKGWSNYVCHQAATSELALNPHNDLAKWALEQVGDTTGDRASVPDELAHWDWTEVSTSTEACLGDKCPLIDLCRPTKARLEASQANIVITNHTMLGLQAATGLPIVLGNRTYGDFHHLVLDEAHEFPGQVRSQGSETLSGARVQSLVKALEAQQKTGLGVTVGLLDTGRSLAAIVEQDLSDFLGTGRKDTKKVSEGDAPLEISGPQVIEWAKAALKDVKQWIASASEDRKQALMRLGARLDKIIETVVIISTHAPGVARWVQRTEQRGGVGTVLEAQASPVNVSSLTRSRLWYSQEGNPLSVTCVSATIPRGFSREMGLDHGALVYPTPFETAFADSALYVPKATDDDMEELVSTWHHSNKASMDTGKHRDWAASKIVDLVSANNGSALVLAATTGGAKHYAERLREALPHLRIHTQWDRATVGQVTTEWREDTGSVLVGTKSLMTGVDAPGDTNSLVIIDRIPRSPSNPLDDARVEDVQDHTGVNQWEARSKVYATDAALRLEQAAGRLIRSVTDVGMVAILDPRLIKKHALSLNETDRQLYLSGVRDFGYKFSSEDSALAYLSHHSRSRAAA